MSDDEWVENHKLFMKRKQWRHRYTESYNEKVHNRIKVVGKITTFGTYLYIIGSGDWDEVSIIRKLWNVNYGRDRFRRRMKQ